MGREGGVDAAGLPAKSWVAGRIQVDEERLRSTIERVLSDRFGRPVLVESLDRSPSRFATLFPADVVHLGLAGGERLSLYLKHLGPEERDHPDKCGPEREIGLYRKFQRYPELPVPRFFGVSHNGKTGRDELFLEYVDGWSLQYQELEHWYVAARALARFHAFFGKRREELLACALLLRLDTDYVTSWTDRACRAVSGHAPDLRPGLERPRELSSVVAGILAGQPPTLVHNDLSPKNVLADRSRTPARISFIDWEMAGVGCGLLDLVHLSYGLEEEPARRMRQAYLEELEGSGLLPDSPDELERVLTACAMHKALYRLAHCQSWKLSPEKVAEFIGELDALADRLDGRGHGGAEEEA